MDALTRYRLNKIEDPNYAEAAYHNVSILIFINSLKHLLKDFKHQEDH